MPHVFSMLTEVTDHVIEPVTHQLVNKVIDELNLRHLVAGNINVDFGYTAISKTTDDNFNPKAHVNKVNCKVNLSMLPTATKWDMNNFTTMHAFGIGNHNRQNDYPVFADPDGQILLYEWNLPCSVVMNFTVSLLDRSVAYELPRAIFSRYAGATGHEHLAFSYSIPNDILSLLYSLWKFRKCDMTFVEYLRKFSASNISYDTKRNKLDDVELLVLKTDLFALSSIDIDEEKPAEQKTNQSADSYEISFTYNAQFACPEKLMMLYPIIVDNQLLPSNMVVVDTNELPKNLKGPHPTGDFNGPLRDLSMVRDSPIQMPFYDDWKVACGAIAKQFSYQEFLIGAFTIDETTGTTAIDLSGDLGEDYRLHPVVTRILKKQLNESFGLDVIFNVSVYSNDAIIEPKLLSLDENLQLTVTCSDIHRLHHLVISEVTSLEWLNPKWYQDLLDILGTYPKLKIIKLLEEYIRRKIITVDYPYLYDKNKMILGGHHNDSYWPFRVLRGDIEATRGYQRDRITDAE